MPIIDNNDIEASVDELFEKLRTLTLKDISNMFLESTAPFSQTIQVLRRETQDCGQSHLELDESTLKSTGKSVSVDDVIAKIDKALKGEI